MTINFHAKLHFFRISCHCGWMSGKSPTVEQAGREFDQHLVAKFPDQAERRPCIDARQVARG